MISFPDDDAEAQHELALERLSKSAAVAQWAAERGMPGELLTHLLFELGLVEREQVRVEFRQF